MPREIHPLDIPAHVASSDWQLFVAAIINRVAGSTRLFKSSSKVCDDFVILADVASSDWSGRADRADLTDGSTHQLGELESGHPVDQHEPDT